MQMISSICRQAVTSQIVAIVLLFPTLCLSPRFAAASDFSETPAVQSPGFSLPDLTGKHHKLDEFTGKVLLVNFWASWCRPCIEEMPAIKRLVTLMHDQPFAVIAINVAESARRVQASVKRLELDFQVLHDSDSAVFKHWGGNILPTAFVVDRSGQVRYIGRGPVEWDRDHIVDLLKQLAAESQPGHE
jgi:peroxiredoxin